MLAKIPNGIFLEFKWLFKSPAGAPSPFGATSPPPLTGKLRLMGLNTTSLVSLLLIALVKTSLAEEILFRGLIAKQLSSKFGFTMGNLLQATFFGMVHLFLLWALTNTTLIPLLHIFAFSSFAGWTIGYIKEKYAHGRIIPGWIAHGLGNTISYCILAYII